jgi:DnaJ-domain-containing protein 1
VSIGRRFVNLIRSNIGSLLDRPGEESSGGGARASHQPLEQLSDEELEHELQQRRARREAAERAANRSMQDEAWEEMEQALREGTGRFRTSGRRAGTYRRSPTGSNPASSTRRPTAGAASPRRDPRLAQLYAQLECPYGSDLATVRKHYRKLMLKYHPDMHSGSPEKQRLATELSQRLTGAYNDLRRHLSSTTAT